MSLNLQCANLLEADLRGANLVEANLQRTNLYDANLVGADLYEADLRNANLQHADLCGANLLGADLRNANLQYADLCGANLLGADLRNANLQYADLFEANLQGADLRNANLAGANLQRTNLYDANLLGADLGDFYIPMICPEEGEFIGWKKLKENYLCKLLIPEDAKRFSATTRKCRCNKAKVLEIISLDKNEMVSPQSGTSKHDPHFVYKVGEMIEVEDFNEERWEECTTGIHFFINRKEAIDN